MATITFSGCRQVSFCHCREILHSVAKTAEFGSKEVDWTTRQRCFNEVGIGDPHLGYLTYDIK